MPATSIPFTDDYKIDADGLARLAQWLVSVRGVGGLLTNGRTGEVGFLLPVKPAPEEIAAVRSALAASGPPSVRLF
jgi:dihydrodipicolinate synthase/N-acetylneuraminate lyase